MRKLILSVLVLFVLGNTTYAADKKESASIKEDKIVNTVKDAPAIAMSYVALTEENMQLRLRTAELTNQLDELKSQFDYSQMMHATLANLQQQEILDKVEDTRIQLDYAGMMNVTLLNLSKLTVQ